ncbi:family 16 glycoside hydrolase [Paenibacillus aestuarii]|uniref:Family 16 glycoside hydrolase n=1 Tax=Paenibacillus aestuarii TaxID=516965 RepID=A0ABW0K2K5_9BACL|nr:exo-alpha-sialidase [Paenibacillus aestuarii]
MLKRTLSAFSILLCFVLLMGALPAFAANGPITWGSTSTVTNINTFTDAGTDARGLHPGTFGSEYPRMLKLANGDWLAVAAIYDNNGYTKVSWGGTRLQVFRSTDNCRTWSLAATLWEDGRDLDNGQLAQLPNGDIVLAMRSVRWQESYQLKVYKSTNNGTNWSYLSMIDQNNGSPGALGNPDKGVYEPHLGFLNDGSLTVMYANEKHVTENPSYSQIISQKISTDGGATWGNEIFVAWDPGNAAARPGMPVWTKMANGQYMVVFEVCGTQSCNIFYKKSSDGKTWASGIGTQIANQAGGPYLLSLTDGRLVVSSNSNVVSMSNDYGATWYTNDAAAFGNTLWGALYQTGANEIAFIDSVDRSVGGHNVQVRFGTLTGTYSNDFSANDNGWAHYGGTWSVSGGTYNLTASSAEKSVLTPYPSLRNYTLEGDIKLNNAGQGSLIFNVMNPATGTDSLSGYGAGIDSTGLIWLGRFNNGWTQLSSVSTPIATNTWYHMKVVVNNGNIKVYVGDMATPKISFTDATFANGTIGVRGGFGNSVSFDNIQVY